MMKANLYIAYSDLEKYLNGEGITAAPKESRSAVFHYAETLNVSVDVTEIISRSVHVERGFVNGDFTYYLIQKGDSK